MTGTGTNKGRKKLLVVFYMSVADKMSFLAVDCNLVFTMQRARGSALSS